MTRQEIPVGVLFSSVGPYAEIGREAREGARAAINEINACGDFAFRFACVEADPQGEADRYAVLAERLMREEGCRHIIGCQTSWSRKEVLPVLERHQGLLWYTAPYEGFESHDRVLYTGACPNQNVVPLFQYAVPAFGNRAYLLGSNYIWGWEVNRIARELLGADGGCVLGERYIPIGDEQVAHLIDEIREKRPDFILNNLIGTSSYAFLRAYRALGQEDPFFHPSRCPVISCNLTEAELPVLGAAAEGVISTSTYFETLETADNRAFLARMRLLRGADAQISAMFTGPYLAAWLLARAIAETGTAEPQGIIARLPDRPRPTPLGPVIIDRQTQHAHLTPHIGVVEGAASAQDRARFRLVGTKPAPLAPDPYLVDYDPHAGFARSPSGAAGLDQETGPQLRLVT